MKKYLNTWLDRVECVRILHGVRTCLCYFLRQMIVRFPSTCPQSASIQGFFYSYGRSSSESGSKSELRLCARRNSTPVQLLLFLTEFVEGGGEGGGCLSLLWRTPHPPFPPKKATQWALRYCTRRPSRLRGPLFASEPCHRVGTHTASLSGSCMFILRASPIRSCTSIEGGLKGAKRFPLCTAPLTFVKHLRPCSSS